MQVGFCGLDKASNSPHSTSQLDVRTICKGYAGFDLAMIVLQVRSLPRLPGRASPHAGLCLAKPVSAACKLALNNQFGVDCHTGRRRWPTCCLLLLIAGMPHHHGAWSCSCILHDLPERQQFSWQAPLPECMLHPASYLAALEASSLCVTDTQQCS